METKRLICKDFDDDGFSIVWRILQHIADLKQEADELDEGANALAEWLYNINKKATSIHVDLGWIPEEEGEKALLQIWGPSEEGVTIWNQVEFDKLIKDLLDRYDEETEDNPDVSEEVNKLFLDDHTELVTFWADTFAAAADKIREHCKLIRKP